MRFGSVCSGIEAASVAWHPLGWRAAFVSEIEDFPSAVLAHHYPGVPNLGDMTKFKEWPDAALDVLVGGTPCQSFSVAGLRKGMADPRGNLALTFLAIADRYRPRWVVWENVPGVLSSLSHDAPDPSAPPAPLDLELDGQEVDTEDEYTAEELHALNCFVAGLSELGYGWSLRVLDAQFAGVPQRRRRVFVVGCLGDWRRAAAVFLERHSLQGNPPPRRQAGQRVAGTIKGGSGERGYPDPSDGNGGGLVGVEDEWPASVAPTLGTSWGDRHPGTSNQDWLAQKGGHFVPDIVMSSGQANAEITSDHAPTLNCLHEAPIVARPVAFQERGRDGGRSVESQEDLAYSLTAPSGGGRRQEMNVAVPMAFAQNSRDEVRMQGGDGQIVGALAAEPGMKQTTYIAFSCKDHGQDASDDVSPTLRSMNEGEGTPNGGGQVAVAIPINADALRGEGTAKTPSADAAGRVRLRDPGLGVGEDGDPAGTVAASGPGAVAFKASHYTRDKDGAPSVIAPPLSADADKGDQDTLVAFSIYPEGGQGANLCATQVDVAPALSSHNEGVPGYDRGTRIAQAMQVRRLTPRECERLQGFEDDYTLIPVGKKMAADGPRYKALGNSMAVPVMRWIGERIAMVDAVKDVEVAA